MANIGITLCRMVDKMMLTYQEKKQQEFITQGGIKERMHAARTGYRQQEQDELHALRQQVKLQAEEIERLQRLIKAHGITI
jgi:four helix bundle suffix protein